MAIVYSIYSSATQTTITEVLKQPLIVYSTCMLQMGLQLFQIIISLNCSVATSLSQLRFYRQSDASYFLGSSCLFTCGF